MKLLFIITGSIAVSRCFEILNELKKNKFKVSCIITINARKLLNINKLKKSISGKIYKYSILDSSNWVLKSD